MLQSLFSSVARNSASWALGKLAVKGLSFLFSIFVIRWLGDAEYGQFILIWSYITIFAMLSDAGLGMFAIREVAKRAPRTEFLTTNIIVLRFFLASITIVLILLTAWLIGYSSEFLSYLALAGPILLLYAVQDPLDALLQAHERFDLAALAVIAGQIIFVTAGLVLLLLGWHITGLILAALLNVAVSIVAAGWLLKPYRRSLQWRLDPSRWFGFVRTSFSFGLIKIWLSWSLKIDAIIISWFWLPAMVGWYGAAYAVVLAVMVVSNAINGALYPVLSRQHSQNPASLPDIYEFGLKYLLLIALPATVGVFLTAGQWVHLLFGDSFIPTTYVLFILIWVIPLAFTSEFLRYVLLATDREKSAVWGLGMAVVFNIGFNLWLVPHYGFFAAAQVAVMTEALLVMLYSWALRAELHALDLVDVLLKPALAAVVLVLAALFSPNGLVWQIAFGGGAYVLAVVLLRAIKPAEYRPLFQLLKLDKRMFLSSSRENKDLAVPLISVFIPVYNCERFVAQAIESVLAQSYQNYELIVIDDGSTDHTAQILNRYKTHSRVRIYHNEQNLGVSSTWNIGVSHCRGDLIAKLDADDFYGPNQLEVIANFYQKHPEVGLIFSGLNLLYPDGTIEAELPFLRSWVRRRHEFLPTLLKLCVVRAPTAFASRKCYDRLGGAIEAMKIHSDWELWVRFAANYPVGYIARRLATYRTNHGANITAKAAIDGRSFHDIKLWLELLQTGDLPYRLTPAEEAIFRQGIYELEMHFAAMAAYRQNKAMEKLYAEFAEQVLQPKPDYLALQRKRQIYLNAHQGLHAFREKHFEQARQFFLKAISVQPGSGIGLWVWNKLLLTYVNRTKWGIFGK